MQSGTLVVCALYSLDELDVNGDWTLSTATRVQNNWFFVFSLNGKKDRIVLLRKESRNKNLLKVLSCLHKASVIDSQVTLTESEKV